LSSNISCSREYSAEKKKMSVRDGRARAHDHTALCVCQNKPLLVLVVVVVVIDPQESLLSCVGWLSHKKNKNNNPWTNPATIIS
jgi:hypothetical protein